METQNLRDVVSNYEQSESVEQLQQARNMRQILMASASKPVFMVLDGMPDNALAFVQGTENNFEQAIYVGHDIIASPSISTHDRKGLIKHELKHLKAEISAITAPTEFTHNHEQILCNELGYPDLFKGVGLMEGFTDYCAAGQSFDAIPEISGYKYTYVPMAMALEKKAKELGVPSIADAYDAGDKDLINQRLAILANKLMLLKIANESDAPDTLKAAFKHVVIQTETVYFDTEEALEKLWSDFVDKVQVKNLQVYTLKQQLIEAANDNGPGIQVEA